MNNKSSRNSIQTIEKGRQRKLTTAELVEMRKIAEETFKVQYPSLVGTMTERMYMDAVMAEPEKFLLADFHKNQSLKNKKVVKQRKTTTSLSNSVPAQASKSKSSAGVSKKNVSVKKKLKSKAKGGNKGKKSVETNSKQKRESAGAGRYNDYEEIEQDYNEELEEIERELEKEEEMEREESHKRALIEDEETQLEETQKEEREKELRSQEARQRRDEAKAKLEAFKERRALKLAVEEEETKRKRSERIEKELEDVLMIIEKYISWSFTEPLEIVEKPQKKSGIFKKIQEESKASKVQFEEVQVEVSSSSTDNVMIESDSEAVDITAEVGASINEISIVENEIEEEDFIDFGDETDVEDDESEDEKFTPKIVEEEDQTTIEIEADPTDNVKILLINLTENDTNTNEFEREDEKMIEIQSWSKKDVDALDEFYDAISSPADEEALNQQTLENVQNETYLDPISVTGAASIENPEESQD